MLLTLYELSLAISYRLRGWGGFLTGNLERRLFWASSVAILGVIQGLNPLYTGPIAFAGMWFSHGKYYGVRTLKEALVMFLIALCRFPSPVIPITLLSATLQVIGYRVGSYLQDKKIVSDALYIAEPLVGAFGFGLPLYLLGKYAPAFLMV